ADFPGALVLISQDREVMDRLCTGVVGLDGRGGAALYGSVEQWLAAYEAQGADEAAAPRPSRPPLRTCPPPKSRKLGYREQQEWEQMEAAILAAEEAVVERQAEVERAAGAGHVALAEACRGLEEAQHTVE